MSQTKLDVNYTITWVEPNIVITYAETYGAESYEGDDLICVAAPGTDHLVNIGSGDTLTTVDWRKETTLGSASRSAFITAVLGLVVEGAATPDNHYIITTKDEFDTAITDATTAAVPYRFEIAAGTYAFTSRVIFPDDGEIRGAGQSVTILTSTAEQNSLAAFELGSNCTFRDLTFDYLDNGSTNVWLASLSPSASSYTRIARCRFTQAAGEALYVGAAGTDAVIEVSDCLFDEPASGAADSGIYVNGTSTGASIRVTGTVFRDMDYGYYCDATGITETITNCLFDNNATNPFFTSSNTARSVVLNNNDFRDCAGDISIPSSISSIASMDYRGNTFDNFSGTRPYQVGETIETAMSASEAYNNTTAVDCSDLAQSLTPGTWKSELTCTQFSVPASRTSMIAVQNNSIGGSLNGAGNPGRYAWGVISGAYNGTLHCAGTITLTANDDVEVGVDLNGTGTSLFYDTSVTSGFGDPDSSMKLISTLQSIK